ncbi:MAG: FkbM family methyltransferase [Spirulina sp. SIO3F2]|nr:FkbM family methyltransferase [Spirulina sp. SIO3F2]
MSSYDPSFQDRLRLKISLITEQHLKFPRKTIPYLLSFIFCKVLDVLLGTRKKSATKRIRGITYQLDTQDLIDFRLFYFGCNENHLINYLQNQIKENHTVLWDIGVNIGSVSLPLIAACPNLQIHAFEASPPVFERLKINVDLNGLTRIKLHKIALGNECRVVDFFVSSMVRNSGVGSLASTSNSTNVPVQVDCYTGDHIIEKKIAIEPSLIKIDVEGFEYEVLAGMRSLLKTAANLKIVFEHEPYRLKERGMRPDKIVNMLMDYGYEMYLISHQDAFYNISQNSLKKFELSMLKHKCDFVAIRE